MAGRARAPLAPFTRTCCLSRLGHPHATSCPRRRPSPPQQRLTRVRSPRPKPSPKQKTKPKKKQATPMEKKKELLKKKKKSKEAATKKENGTDGK